MNTRQGLSLLTIACIICSCTQTPSEPKRTGKEQGIEHAFEYEFLRTYDPALGYPPKERMLKAFAQIEQMRKTMANTRSSGVANPKFLSRGPNNIGGRTRAIHIDLRDPQRKTLWVGSVAGGVWKTSDITETNPDWISVDDYLANLAIGSITQDPTDPEIFYVGTGEGFINADAVRGLGIFKSSDGGNTWSLLPTTDNVNFRFTRSILVHPVTGHVYAATRSSGVMRSMDKGQTWVEVLGNPFGTDDDSMYDIVFAQGQLFASSSSKIFSSASGDRHTWVDLTRSTSGFPSDLSRTEMSVCESDINVICAVGNLNGSGSPIYRTTNGGTSWSAVERPTGGDFTNGQAWYDLEIAVDPFNCDHIVVGGVGSYRSLSAGLDWQRVNELMHVDQHKVLFDPVQEDVVYFGNDGGVWRSVNGSSVDPASRNTGYITSQYYACALHPGEFVNYYLGGTQDNGSHRLSASSGGTAFGVRVRGGDGFFCHIDQDEPHIQMVSSQFGSWGLSTDGGSTFSGGQEVNGGFVNPSDYDNKANILYTETNNADFSRWSINTNLLEEVDIISTGGEVRAVHVDPNVDNRLYLGMDGGRVLRIDNAHTGLSVDAVEIFSGPGSISGIDVMIGDPLTIIVTASNYGIDNVFHTTDGGDNWLSDEGNLPDMPVRAVVFNPRNKNEAMIATEAGVWTTTLLDGPNTIWIPPAPGRGIPLARTDDLEVRTSDYVVLAASHGRGLWTTSAFADPRAVIFAQLVHYVNSPLRFVGDASLNAETYEWDFGDNKTSTDPNPLHTYEAVGEYVVRLTINGTLTTTERIKILPDVDLPYVKGRTYYGGSFEDHPEQHGVQTLSGSSFELGNSQITGKNGTKSGVNAFVIGLNEPTYQSNTETYLYLPVFDFTEESIYTFSFWARYFLHPGPDGFQVQYSTDRGQSWEVLGTSADKKWYNFNNTDVVTTAFPNGSSYFTTEVGGYTNYTHDLSFLSGSKDVAFRFVFRSERTGHHVGAAIDDIEIFSYEGELKTTLTSFNGEFGADKAINLTWSTTPEYYCKRFLVERSTNGIDFEEIDQVQAKSGLSANTTAYTHTSNGGRDLYFYRLRVINENTPTGYYYEFYSDVITLRRNPDDAISVHNLYPNPFTDHLNVTFNDVVDQNVKFQIFDATGKLMYEQTAFVNSPFFKLELAQWPLGVYFLSIQIGEEEEIVYPVLSSTQ